MTSDSANSTPQGQDNSPGPLLPGDVAELLVSRVVDGVATDRDWATFETVAGKDVGAWRDLAMDLAATQRDASALSRAVESHTQTCVQLPSESEALTPISISRGQKIWAFTRGGLGWVAAAALALAIYTGRFNNRSVGPADSRLDTASLVPSFSDAIKTAQPQDLLNAYIDRGMESSTVLGELPDKVMLQAQPVQLSDGTTVYDVVYVRQILERSRIPNLYQVQVGPRDELGNAPMQKVPLRLPARRGST